MLTWAQRRRYLADVWRGNTAATPAVSLIPNPDEGHKLKRSGLTIQLLCILQVSLEFYLFRVFPFSMHQQESLLLFYLAESGSQADRRCRPSSRSTLVAPIVQARDVERVCARHTVYISIHIKVTVCPWRFNILSLDLWLTLSAVIHSWSDEKMASHRKTNLLLSSVDYSIMSEPDCNWIIDCCLLLDWYPRAKATNPPIYCIAHRASNRKAAIQLEYSCSVPFLQ